MNDELFLYYIQPEWKSIQYIDSIYNVHQELQIVTSKEEFIYTS